MGFMNPSSLSFVNRHIGPNQSEINQMLQFLGLKDLNALNEAVVPKVIHLNRELNIPKAATEDEVLAELKSLSRANQIFATYIGMGYADSLIPTVIQRNILENPGWYTQYTPYQAEISQGRLEALINFQTLVCELTGLAVANASLLDEATACAEAMTMARNLVDDDSINTFFVDRQCHPQILAVLQTRAQPIGIQVLVGDAAHFDFATKVFGVLVSYPDTEGRISDLTSFFERAKKEGAVCITTSDLLSLVALKAPADFGADISVGSAQRLGVPLGYGGPHAAFMACRDEYKRKMPGRIAGVSKDAEGRPGYRLSLQTREQHIRREKATSNICTAQVLLAVMASMYGVYHGPQGLKEIVGAIHKKTQFIACVVSDLGLKLGHQTYFDTLKILADATFLAALKKASGAAKINLRYFDDGFGLTLDETTTAADLLALKNLFETVTGKKSPQELSGFKSTQIISEQLIRSKPFMTQKVFNEHHSETEMLRYIKKLESRDLSLTTSMIPLGSCTMKLNATSEMYPVSYAGFSGLHPFVPLDQAQGYQKVFSNLESWLAEITGFDAVSLQPNAGSQGEYAGLLVIRKYHEKRGESARNICLIPASAHGTNPATAVMAGFKVVVVKCDANGNVDMSDLKLQAEAHAKDLGCLMITYPSTHGVFETSIREICDLIHSKGGQVYMDGANMNAQVGLCRPADFGADVCHLNLHKTFCIPHGGGGPGMGPIGVKAHLKEYLPSNPVVRTGGEQAIPAVSAAPWGSASILPIPYAYIRLMGPDGLKQATMVAILNANYIAKKLDPYFPVLYKGANGLVAHECIVDVRPLKAQSGIDVEDVAKRLMDYGFHAPTVSFPVPGTLMIEPTESESVAELDRFCDAMIAIHGEIQNVIKGVWDKKNNPLKNAPHTATAVMSDNWDRPYTRDTAVYPLSYIKEHKFWPYVSRIDAAYGDRNLVCTCPSVEEYQ